jgi:hypothetical protein
VTRLSNERFLELIRSSTFSFSAMTNGKRRQTLGEDEDAIHSREEDRHPSGEATLYLVGAHALAKKLKNKY